MGVLFCLGVIVGFLSARFFDAIREAYRDAVKTDSGEFFND